LFAFNLRRFFFNLCIFLLNDLVGILLQFYLTFFQTAILIGLSEMFCWFWFIV